MVRDAVAELREVRQRRQVVNATTAPAMLPWPELNDLPAMTQTFSVPKLDSSLLPRALRPWIADVAMRASLPLEMVAVPAMVAFGALIARRVGIRPSREDDWTVVCNLWGAIVGRPGLLKSHAVSAALWPLSRLESEARIQWQNEAQEIEAKREAITAQISGVKGAIQQAAKKNTNTESHQARLQDLMSDLAEIPTGPKRYVVSDATQEKIADMLIRHPHGLTMVRDELMGWLASMEQDNHKADRPFFLTAWNGDQGYSVDRIGRGSLWVPCLCLSLIGTIQPAKIEPYVEDAERNGGADGLIARVQLLVWPDAVPVYSQPGRPDHVAREAARLLAESMADLDPKNIGALRDYPDSLPYLRFASDAQSMWDTWRSRLEARLRGQEFIKYPAFESHISKYRSLVPSLALIIHLCDGATGDVSLDALQRATAWAVFLEAHARKVYRRELDHGDSSARALLNHIQSGDVTDGTTVRDIYRRHWEDLTDKQSVVRAVEILEALGWTRIETRSNESGRPVEVIAVNPEALKT